MIDDRNEIRLRVDWDNDGFINSGVSSDTPTNLIPQAAYAAGAKCAYVIDTIHYNDTEVKDVNEYGFTKFQADMSTADSLLVGSGGTLSDVPNGVDPNIYDIKSFMNSEGNFKLTSVDDAPFAFDVYEIAQSYESGSTVLFNLKMPSGLTIGETYIFSMWARAKRNTTDTPFTLTNEVQTTLVTSERNTVQFTESTLADDTWSDWYQLHNIVTFTDIDEYWSLSFNNGGSPLSASALYRLQVGGFMVTQPTTSTDTFDNKTIEDENNSTTTWDATDGYEMRIDTNADDRYFELDTTYSLADGESLFINIDFEIERVNSSNSYKVEIINASDDTVLWDDGGYLGVPSSFTQKNEVAYVKNDTGSSIDLHIRFYNNETTTGNYGMNVRNLEMTKHTLPSAYYKKTIVPNEDRGYVRLASGTAHNYSFQMWRETAGSSSVSLEVFGLALATGERTSLVTDTITVTEDVTRYNLVIPSQGSDYMFLTEFTTADSITLNIKANQITQGTGIYVFNVGDVPSLDDISSYVRSVVWQLGRSDFDSPLAYEGTLEVLLNNDGKEFSVNNPNSPFFGYMRKNLKVLLEIKNGLTWATLWTGWTSEFEINAGRTNNREMTLLCEQGMFRIREGEFSYEPTERVTVKDVVSTIVANSGWRSAKSPFSFTLGFSANLGINTYLQATEDIFTTIDETSELLDLVGMDWGKETETSEALKDILDSENAKLWIDKEGGLVLRNRKHIINAVDNVTASLVLDTTVQDATYEYGDKIVNRVEVIYEPKNEVRNAEIWRTKNPIFVPKRNARNIYKISTVRLPMHFTFEEQRQRTITNVRSRMNDFDITVTHSQTGEEITSIDGSIWVAVSSDGGSYYELQIRNEFEYAVNVEVVVYGDYIEGGSPQTHTVEDIEAQEYLQAVHKETIKVKQLGEFDKAKNMADWLLKRYAYPKGAFKNLSYAVKDATTLNNIITWDLGDILKITETQTGESNRYHTIIAIEGSYMVGDVPRINYVLDRASDSYYNKVGYSTATTATTNLAPELDIVNASVFGADKAITKKAAFLSENGESALEIRSYRLGGTVWFGNSDAYQVARIGSDNNWYKGHADPSLSDYYDSNNAVRSFYNRQYLQDTPVFGSPSQAMMWGLWDKKDSATPNDWGVLHNFPNSIYRLSQAPIDLVHQGSDYTADNYIAWMVDDADNTVDSGLSIVNALDYELHEPPTTQAAALYEGQYHYTDEFFFKPYSVPFWIQSVVLNSNGKIQDPAILDLQRLNNITLAQNTTYYVSLWGASEAGRTVDIDVVILEHDGLTEHNVALTFDDAHGKQGGSFTTSASLTETRCTVWIRFTDTELDNPIYLTGFAITEINPTTLTEANTANNLVARIFV